MGVILFVEKKKRKKVSLQSFHYPFNNFQILEREKEIFSFVKMTHHLLLSKKQRQKKHHASLSNKEFKKKTFFHLQRCNIFLPNRFSQILGFALHVFSIKPFSTKRDSTTLIIKGVQNISVLGMFVSLTPDISEVLKNKSLIKEKR